LRKRQIRRARIAFLQIGLTHCHQQRSEDGFHPVAARRPAYLELLQSLVGFSHMTVYPKINQPPPSANPTGFDSSDHSNAARRLSCSNSGASHTPGCARAVQVQRIQRASGNTPGAFAELKRLRRHHQHIPRKLAGVPTCDSAAVFFSILTNDLSTR
jgi:hypothetical protein